MTKEPTSSIPSGWYYNDTPGGDNHSHYALNDGNHWTWACVGDASPLFLFEPADQQEGKFGVAAMEPYWKKGRQASYCPTCWEKRGLRTIVEDLLDEDSD